MSMIRGTDNSIPIDGTTRLALSSIRIMTLPRFTQLVTIRSISVEGMKRNIRRSNCPSNFSVLASALSATMNRQRCPPSICITELYSVGDQFPSMMKQDDGTKLIGRRCMIALANLRPFSIELCTLISFHFPDSIRIFAANGPSSLHRGRIGKMCD